MGDFITMERIVWFDNQIRQSAFPNAWTLARRFEVHRKTAKRTIEKFRDRFNAPLVYDYSRKGYFYSDDSYRLPPFQITHDEVLGLLLAQKLLSTAAGGFISRSIENFARKIFIEARQAGLTEKDILEGFSASWHGHSPAHLKTFRSVAQALLQKRAIAIIYSSPGAGETTERVVRPHHLQYYMASWVLLAWCEKRNDWRKFVLSRISSYRTLDRTFDAVAFENFKHLLDSSFGIFQGAESEAAVLRFNPFRARWIQEQVWHPKQEISVEPSGHLLLRFPVSDYREISMKILQFGADVEVLEPFGLRKKISEEIRKMAEIY